MGYRIGEHKHQEPRRTLDDVTTPSNIFIINGEISRLAIPCWYFVIDPPKRAHHHNRMHHDHIGWPSPNHPDHICQSWDFASSCCSHDSNKHHCDHCSMFIDLSKLAPVHLLSEGYTHAVIEFDEDIDGLIADCDIDNHDDWIIRININAKCKDAIKEKIKIRYTIFVGNEDELNDVAATGFLTILPGPYTQGD